MLASEHFHLESGSGVAADAADVCLPGARLDSER
jgi:hypothetical protein